MKKIIVVMLVIVAVVIIGLTGLFVAAMAGANIGLPFNFAEPSLVNRQTFSANELDAIDISYSSESITLLPSSTGEVVLEEYMNNWEEDMLAQINTSGGKLQIRSGRRNFGFINFWNAKIYLYVPQEWLGDMRIESTSGSIKTDHDWHFATLDGSTHSGGIHMEDLATDGNLALQATSGGVRVGDLDAGGSIRLQSSSGGVRWDAATAATSFYAKTTSGSAKGGSAIAPEIEAGASSGGVSIDYVEGRFDLSSTSGSVHVEGGAGYGKASSSSGGVTMALDELKGDLSLSATSGGVKLELPSSSAFDFSAETTSGSVRTSFDDQLSVNEGRSRASGSVNGGGYKLDCRSSSGGVRVEWD